ncbi:hypothetical protein [Litoribacter populi]|uniref:hypothetical protein n=1 Tax=Litoribacter populi TaxID=2598460 RepID=UPI00117C01FF|nr:hypothetical protein [Litoribacter populi]
MRQLFLIAIFLFTMVLPSIAQLQQGNFIISGDISYSQNSFPERVGGFPEKEKDLRLTPRIGYMLTDTWALGIQGGYQAYSEHYESIVQRYIQEVFTGQMDNNGNPVLHYFVNERFMRTFRENQLWSLGPYVQKFFPLSEKAFLNLSAHIAYLSGNNGTFGIRNSFLIPNCPNCMSVVSPAVTELTMREKYWTGGIDFGLNYFFTSRLALDLQVQLLQWRSGEYKALALDTHGIFMSSPQIHFNQVRAFNFLQNAGGLRVGLLVAL